MDIFDYHYDEFTTHFWAFTAFNCYLLYIQTTHKKIERLLVEKERQFKIKEDRKRIATEMHDDLGADLSNLMIKLKIYQQSIGIQLSKDYQEIEQFTKTIISKVNETIWALNSDKDNLLALSNFMLKYANDLFIKNQLKLKINNFEPLPEKPMSIEIRRNIYLLYKKVINHLIFLDIANNLEIDLTLNEDLLQITLLLAEKESHLYKIEFSELIQQEISTLQAEMNYYKTNNMKATLELKIKLVDY